MRIFTKLLCHAAATNAKLEPIIAALAAANGYGPEVRQCLCADPRCMVGLFGRLNADPGGGLLFMPSLVQVWLPRHENLAVDRLQAMSGEDLLDWFCGACAGKHAWASRAEPELRRF